MSRVFRNFTLCCSSDCFVLVLVPCQNKSDIVIVLDASGSLGQENYIKGIGFAQFFIPNYVISSEWINIGLIYFSESPTTAVEMNSADGRNASKIKQVLEQLKQKKSTGLSHLNRALTQADQMLQRGRSGVPDFVVVIADGSSTNDPGTLDEPLRRLRNRGATILVTEIGWQPSEKNLIKIAGIKDRIKKLRTSAEFWESGRWIAKQTCSGK